MTHPEPTAADDAKPRARTWRQRLWLPIATVLLACFGLLVYGVVLIVTLPASALRDVTAIPAQVTDLYGGIWQGRAVLQGGYTLDWDTRGWPLIAAQGVVDWTLQGPDTLLTGVATVTPWSVTGREIVGRAGPGLIALVPGAVFSNCTSRAVVDVQEVSARRDAFAAAGAVSFDEGTCDDVLGRTTSLPAMTLDLSTRGADAVGELRDRGGRLALVTLSGDRRIILRIEPEGATLLPGMPTGGPMVVEYPF